MSLCASHMQSGAFVVVGGRHVYIWMVVVEPVNGESLGLVLL